MKYTSRTAHGAVTVQRITPIDPRIVRAIFSVKIPGYRTQHSEALLNTYEHLALKKTRKKTDSAIDSYIRKHGLLFSVSSGDGFIHFAFSAEREKFKHGLTLVHEVLHETVFAQKHINEIRELLREENREAHDDAKIIADIAFSNIVYPRNSQFATDTLTERLVAINAINHKKLADLKADLLKGEWFISVVADKKTADVIAAFVSTLRTTAGQIRYRFEHTLKNGVHSEFITVPGKSNVEVRMGGYLTMHSNDEAYVPFLFGLAVLGKVGGFSGRLMSTVREKEGLTYGIYAHAEHVSRDTEGHWKIFTFFTAPDLKKGLASTLHQVKLIIQKGITIHELQTFKEIYKNQFRVAHESNSRRLRFYHALLLSLRTENDLLREMQCVESLTRDEVNRALQTYLVPENLIIVGAGPVNAKGEGIVR